MQNAILNDKKRIAKLADGNVKWKTGFDNARGICKMAGGFVNRKWIANSPVGFREC